MNRFKNPDKWTPTDTEMDVPDVGTIKCHVDFVGTEDEGTKKVWDQRANFGVGEWIIPQRTKWTARITWASLQSGKDTISTPFTQGSYFTKPPTATDVVSSLVLDASWGDYSLDDLFSEMGLSKPSEAQAMYDTIQKTELNLRRMFGSKYDVLVEWANEQ